MSSWNLKYTFFFVLLCFFSLVLFVANIFFGSVSIPLIEVWKILTQSFLPQKVTYSFIIFENRVPQAITAMLCGVALSVSGYLLQKVFRNALAGPSLMGVDAGAALGVAIVMLLTRQTDVFMPQNTLFLSLYFMAALCGAFSVLILVLFVSTRINNSVLVLIVGVLVSYFASSIIALLNFFAGAENIQAYYMWGLGSFQRTSWQEIPWLVICVGIGLGFSLLLIKPLNLWQLGDNYVKAMGLNLNKIRTFMLLTAGFLTATSVAFCGPIGFIGLAVPHLVMIFLRSQNSSLALPFVVLTGINIALCCNLVSNLFFNGITLPLNVITPWVGTPIIIWIIWKHRVK